MENKFKDSCKVIIVSKLLSVLVNIEISDIELYVNMRGFMFHFENLISEHINDLFRSKMHFAFPSDRKVLQLCSLSKSQFLNLVTTNYDNR